MVLLHPWFGCCQFWHRTFDHFIDRTRIAVDFYSLADGDWSRWAGPVQMAESVLSVMDHEGLEYVDLVGNSVGGIVAQVVASKYPQRVRKLVLVGTGAHTTGVRSAFVDTVDHWIAAARRNETPSRSFIEATVSMLVSSDLDAQSLAVFADMLAKTEPMFIATVLTEARRLDLSDELGKIRASTLVIRGTEDRVRTRDHAFQLANAVRDARWYEMQAAGHAPMLDSPDEFERLLAEHLS